MPITSYDLETRKNHMKWTEVCVHTNAEASDLVSFHLQDLGAEGVSIEDPDVLKQDWKQGYGEIVALNPADYPVEGIRIKTYLPEMVDVEGFCRELQTRLIDLKEMGIDPAPAEISTQVVEEDSWANAWKQYYKPVRITEKLTIQPVWEEYVPESEEEMVIRLDPGMAFGTGTHPTTSLCMKLLEKYQPDGASVIDVGCGSGILSIASARLGAQSVLALDLDPVAVRSSKENIALNELEDKISCREGDLLKGVSQTADLVVSNILAEIIILFTHDLPRVLEPGGTFIASGIIEEKQELVLQSLHEAGLEVVETIYQEGWVAIAAKKW